MSHEPSTYTRAIQELTEQAPPLGWRSDPDQHPLCCGDLCSLRCPGIAPSHTWCNHYRVPVSVATAFCGNMPERCASCKKEYPGE